MSLRRPKLSNTKGSSVPRRRRRIINCRTHVFYNLYSTFIIMNSTSFKPSTKKVNSSPSNSLGKNTPFFSLPLTSPTHHLKKQTKTLPFYSTHSATLPLTVYLPTTTTGMYLSNTIHFT